MRSPVGPDAEFEVAEPHRALPVGEAFHCRGPGAGGDGLGPGVHENLERGIRVGGVALCEGKDGDGRQ